jgi:hypothetical protein
MEIQRNNCKSLRTDELFAVIVARNVKGNICSPIAYGCIARPVTFLNQNRHVVGVEAGICDGVTPCLTKAFNHIVSSIASVSEREKV